MVSRRAALQNQTEKVSRNWAEESGMRQFIAVSRRPPLGHPKSERPEAGSKFPGTEPDFLGTWGIRRKPNQD